MGLGKSLLLAVSTAIVTSSSLRAQVPASHVLNLPPVSEVERSARQLALVPNRPVNGGYRVEYHAPGEMRFLFLTYCSEQKSDNPLQVFDALGDTLVIYTLQQPTDSLYHTSAGLRKLDSRGNDVFSFPASERNYVTLQPCEIPFVNSQNSTLKNP